MLDKKFIRSNFSNFVVSILFVKKFDENLKMCVDYKALNVLTIKNRNIFSLIRKTLIRLCVVKFYNKFDIIVVFNEIRIREKNKTKLFFSFDENSSNML